jgi:hypothetical protein
MPGVMQVQLAAEEREPPERAMQEQFKKIEKSVSSLEFYQLYINIFLFYYIFYVAHYI